MDQNKERLATAKAAGKDGDMPISVRIILAAMKMIYTKPEPFLQMIKSTQDPKQGIAQATKLILAKIAESAQANGVPMAKIKELTPVVYQRIGPVIGSLLAELAVEAGVADEATLGVKPKAEQPEEAEA